jgi:hypothetical protein
MSPTSDQMPEAMADLEYLTALYDAMEAVGEGSDSHFEALRTHTPGFKATRTVAPQTAADDTTLSGQHYSGWWSRPSSAPSRSTKPS